MAGIRKPAFPAIAKIYRKAGERAGPPYLRTQVEVESAFKQAAQDHRASQARDKAMKRPVQNVHRRVGPKGPKP